MADIHIVRDHALGLEQARKLAMRWAEVAEQKLGVACSYVQGGTSDLVSFKRPGAHGQLQVTQDRFELKARLGLLLGVFRHRIHSEIVRNLDQLLAEDDPLGAFEQGLASHEAKQAARHAPRHAKSHADAHKAATKTAARPTVAPPRKN